MTVGSDLSNNEKEKQSRESQSEKRSSLDRMHATGSFAVAGVTTYFLCVISIATTYPTKSTIQYQVTENVLSRKCCGAGYAFNEDFECIHVDPDRFNYMMGDTWTMQQEGEITTVIASAVQGLNCREDVGLSSNRLLRTYAPAFYTPKKYCVEKMTNGTLVFAKCPSSFGADEDDAAPLMLMATTKTNMRIMTISKIVTTTSTSTTNASSSDVFKDEKVRRGLRAVIFWGAQTYMDTNVAHVVLCIIVVAIYVFVPELGKSIYNRAVLYHNICLLLQGCLLTFLGYCDLYNWTVTDNFALFLWIAQQYFTNATIFWLNVICFDMTLSITRFRWMLGSGQRTSEEHRRLFLYSVFAWGGALIPAVIAFILEYCPGISEDFPLKPNYHRYRSGPNVVVNLYFFALPLLTLFWNNVLFVFTTYKIIRIQRSTEIATQGQNNALRKKYFLFLQLYLLMGAPWFFGLLLACLNNLVILKVCRLTQPILWLLMLASHKKLRQKLADKLRCFKRRREATIATIS